MKWPAAAVFDMDGTLVDNMAFHGRAWMTMCERMGVKGLTLHDFERRYAGQKNSEILPQLLGRELAPGEGEALASTKEALYREAYLPSMAPVRGALAFIDALQAAGVPCAIASAAPLENRTFILDGLGIRHRFVVEVGQEHVARGKPHPDLFLAAATRLGVDPAQCWAFEDAIAGVTSAVAAGMTTYALTTQTPAQPLLDVGAKHAATDYVELASIFGVTL
jgi:beta-phosphoglucomutase